MNISLHIGTSIHDPRRGDGAYIWVVEAIRQSKCSESVIDTISDTGFERHTTKNRLTLLALLDALSRLKEGCKVVIYSRSTYIRAPIEQGWIYKWAANGWRTRDKPLANDDLWQGILCHLEHYSVSWADEEEPDSYREWMERELIANRTRIEASFYRNMVPDIGQMGGKNVHKTKEAGEPDETGGERKLADNRLRL